MNQFPDIYTGRIQHAGWNAIQAATLMEEAKSRRSGSLLIYAALELRLAIEQLVFTIILVAMGRPTPRPCAPASAPADCSARWPKSPRSTRKNASSPACSCRFIPRFRKARRGT